jgi:hypothetical protein
MARHVINIFGAILLAVVLRALHMPGAVGIPIALAYFVGRRSNQ